MRSASHSLVWPCRRSSSLMICPMLICIKTASLLSGSRFRTTNQLNKKARDLRERSALMLVGARICPEFEPHVISIIAILCLFYYSVIFLYILFLVLYSILSTRGVVADIRYLFNTNEKKPPNDMKKLSRLKKLRLYSTKKYNILLNI